MSRLLCVLFGVLATASLSAEEPAPMVSYTPLSDHARASGQLERYDGVATVSGTLETAGGALCFEVPETVRAYDVVPIRYRLRLDGDFGRTALAATAFETEARRDGRDLYDLSSPGDMGIAIAYMGSVSADLDPSRMSPITSPDSPPSDFPPLRRDEMTRSGVIREAEAIWFRFRVTNTGDTILDPEGIGASFAFPELLKLDDQGEVEWTAQTVNHYERHLEYVYPGESFECWVNFYCPRVPERQHGLFAGRYRVRFSMCCKYHREWHWGVNIWHGMPFARLEFPITVTPEGGDAPVETTFEVTNAEEKMPGYLAAFEEFMTSFQTYPASSEGRVEEGVLYLQVAPWTEQVTLKLIHTAPKSIRTVRIPVTVTDETLRIRPNPDNIMTLTTPEGDTPAFIAQEMPGMRSGFQLGPYPEVHLRERIRFLKACGVNLLTNTAGSWWLPEMQGSERIHLLSETYKFFYDVLAREEGMKCVGWSLYPPSSEQWVRHAERILGKELDVAPADAVYGQHAGVDLGDPAIPEVIAAAARFNYERWGDLWFTTKDGRVPIDIEDTWGWMRDDINLRYTLGPKGVARFRAWVREKYGDITAVNAAWGSAYADFDAIDPQSDQGVEGDGMDHGPVYNRPEHVFHDWSPATEDWDRFRTTLRLEIYREAQRIMREFLPGASLCLRTEGANLVVPGDPKGTPHQRHLYYSQRRNAMVYDVVREMDVLHFYSDYTTLPYSETHWRRSMREMTDAGIIPAFLPQFDRMRDVVLNPHYGREYQVHYGLDAPRQGMVIQSLIAAYPWWKATYEEGGAPGIIWSDYLCDGFATETQAREAKLLRERLQRAVNAAE